MQFPQAASMLKPPESYKDDYATGYRGRPLAPRQLRATAGSLEALLTWNLPVDSRGIVGFRIYKDNENNLVEEIKDANRRQVTVKLPGDASAMFYVSCFSQLNRESPKIAVMATSNNDKLVQAGTTGETGGSDPEPPPGWPDEPPGGGGEIYQF